MSHKTYFTSERTRAWAHDVVRIARSHEAVSRGNVSVFAVPGVLDVAPVCDILLPEVAVGVQDVSEHEPGAWTGEISAAVAAELGCRIAEIGHAERREHYGETDAVVARKTVRALTSGLTPLICVGERSQQRSADAVDETMRQIQSALAEARAQEVYAPVLIGYEPVWAIGAPRPAADDHIRAVAGELRERLRDLSEFEGSRLLYGGAAGPGLLTRVGDSVDGLFLGRFAHDPAALADIIDEAAALLPSEYGRNTT